MTKLLALSGMPTYDDKEVTFKLINLDIELSHRQFRKDSISLLDFKDLAKNVGLSEIFILAYMKYKNLSYYDSSVRSALIMLAQADNYQFPITKTNTLWLPSNIQSLFLSAKRKYYPGRNYMHPQRLLNRTCCKHNELPRPKIYKDKYLDYQTNDYDKYFGTLDTRCRNITNEDSIIFNDTYKSREPEHLEPKEKILDNKLSATTSFENFFMFAKVEENHNLMFNTEKQNTDQHITSENVRQLQPKTYYCDREHFYNDITPIPLKSYCPTTEFSRCSNLNKKTDEEANPSTVLGGRHYSAEQANDEEKIYIKELPKKLMNEETIGNSLKRKRFEPQSKKVSIATGEEIDNLAEILVLRSEELENGSKRKKMEKNTKYGKQLLE